MRSILAAIAVFISTAVFAEIPLPPTLFYDGSITVLDPSNASHAAWVRICVAFYDSKFRVNYNSVGQCTLHSFGEKVSLPPRTYRLSLVPLQSDEKTQRPDWPSRIQNFSSTLVTLKPSENLSIQLVAKTLQKDNGGFSVELFRDLDNPRERDLFLQIQWAEGLPQYNVERLYSWEDSWCRIKKLGEVSAKACRALKSRNYQGLSDTFLFSKGGYHTVDLPTEPTDKVIQSEDRFHEVVVRNIMDGETVALFPGTYGADYTNPTGFKDTVLDIDFTK